MTPVAFLSNLPIHRSSLSTPLHSAYGRLLYPRPAISANIHTLKIVFLSLQAASQQEFQDFFSFFFLQFRFQTRWTSGCQQEQLWPFGRPHLLSGTTMGAIVPSCIAERICNDLLEYWAATLRKTSLSRWWKSASIQSSAAHLSQPAARPLSEIFFLRRTLQSAGCAQSSSDDLPTISSLRLPNFSTPDRNPS